MGVVRTYCIYLIGVADANSEEVLGVAIQLCLQLLVWLQVGNVVIVVGSLKCTIVLVSTLLLLLKNPLGIGVHKIGNQRRMPVVTMNYIGLEIKCFSGLQCCIRRKSKTLGIVSVGW